MSKLKISYNPFNVKTTIELNDVLMTDEQIKKDNIFKVTQGRRIQQWIDKVFTKELFERLNENEIEFEFEGTDLGVGDVRSAVDEFNENHKQMGIALLPSYIAHPSNVDKKAKKVKELFEEAQSGPFDEFRSKEMHSAFEKAFAPEFDVTVLATMSAGKSTVINATLGKEVLPSKNEACTATIARVINDDDMTAFKARRLDQSNQVINDWAEFKEEELLETISHWNDDSNTSKIEVKGNIPEIKLREGIQLAFVDTPGPNNSNDASHKAATVKAINSSQPSMVLYILNSTQLGVDDDKGLLDLIRDAMSQGGREAHDRFIFIANKIDMLDSEKESVAGVINNVKKYLSDNGIVNPLVVPISAELAKLLRIKKNSGGSALTRRQKRLMDGLIDQFVEEEEMNLLEQVKNDIDRNTYRKMSDELEKAKAANDDERVAEILSGIPIIETLLDNYLTKHAVPSRIKDGIDAFGKVAHENEIMENMNNILQQNEDDLNKIVGLIEEFESNEERIAKAKDFKETLNNLRYKTSKEAEQRRRQVDKKFNDLLDDLADDFGYKLEPSHAKTIMSKAERKGKDYISEIQEILSEDLENNQYAIMEELRNDYQKYVEDLLSGFPDEKNMSFAKKLQSSALEMPDVRSLISDATYTETRKEYRGTERHGFLWMKKRKVYDTFTEEKVDMSEVGKEFEEHLQMVKMKIYDEFDSVSRSNFEQAKKLISEHMNALDSKLDSVVSGLRDASNNKSKKQEEIEANNLKIDWFNNFSDKLNEALLVSEEG